MAECRTRVAVPPGAGLTLPLPRTSLGVTARSIRSEELDACCALGDGTRFADVVRTLWKEGESSPAPCLVVEQDGNLVGRVSIHHRSSSSEFDAFGLYNDRSIDFDGAGTALLNVPLPASEEKAGTSQTPASPILPDD